MVKGIWIVVSIIAIWWLIGKMLFGNTDCCSTKCDCMDKKSCNANLAGYIVPKGWDKIENCVEGFNGNAMKGCSTAKPSCKGCPDSGYDTTCRDIFPLYLQEWSGDKGCLAGDWCYDKPFTTNWVDPLPELERAPIIGCSMPDLTRQYVPDDSCNPRY